jgi:hypothetical protein
VVPSLEEIDALISDAVDQTVFLCDTARPATRKHKSQWLWFSWAVEGVAQDCFNEIENSDRYSALIFDPKPQVLKELGLKDSNPFSLPLHRTSLFALRRLSAL